MRNIRDNMIRLISLAPYVLMAVGAAYLVQKALLDASDTTDFKSIWLAGMLWLEGVNPYEEIYAETGRELFMGKNRPHAWFYPPNWWPIATVSAAAEYEFAGRAWRAGSGVLLVCLCLYLWRRLSRLLPQIPGPIFAVMCAFAFTMSATAFTLSLGQTSIALLAGVALFLTSWLARDRVGMAVALAVVALKPTLRLPLAGLLLAAQFWWPALAAGGAAALLMASPAFLMHGVGDVVGLMLARLGEYGEFSVNAPPSTTGLRNLIFHATSGDAPTLLLTAAGFICAALISWAARRLKDPRRRAEAFAAALVTTLACAPLRTYDLVVMIPLVAIAWVLPPLSAIATACALFIAWRLNNLAGFTGLSMPGETYFSGSMIISVALVGLALMLAGRIARRSAQPSPSG